RVRLLPGFSQLDWAKLKSSGENLRVKGVTGLRRITRSELKEHRSLKDGEVWSSFNSKVYNLTSYLDFHPGGRKELLRVGGKDGTELFMKTHAWISVDSMMDTCLIRLLV
ncbi:cytochrome b5-like heme/steroid binding domain-containing protein, partial [Phakopsora pachyrhizi]